jgi:hypothetical protein
MKSMIYAVAVVAVFGILSILSLIASPLERRR